MEIKWCEVHIFSYMFIFLCTVCLMFIDTEPIVKFSFGQLQYQIKFSNSVCENFTRSFTNIFKL